MDTIITQSIHDGHYRRTNKNPWTGTEVDIEAAQWVSKEPVNRVAEGDVRLIGGRRHFARDVEVMYRKFFSARFARVTWQLVPGAA